MTTKKPNEPPILRDAGPTLEELHVRGKAVINIAVLLCGLPKDEVFPVMRGAALLLGIDLEALLYELEARR